MNGCFLCKRAASWRGVVGTAVRYSCDDHAGMIELLKRRHPFQSSIRVLPTVPSGGQRRGGFETRPSPLPGDLSGDAP